MLNDYQDAEPQGAARNSRPNFKFGKEAEPDRAAEEKRGQPRPLSQVVATLFNKGLITTTPSAIMNKLISCVRIHSHPTISHLIKEMQERKYNLNLSSVDLVLTLLSTLETDYEAESDVGVGVILFLVERGMETPTKRKIQNLVNVYVTSSDKKRTIEEIEQTGIVPIISSSRQSYDDIDFNDLLSLILTVMFKANPHDDLIKEKESWKSIKCGTSLEEYLDIEGQRFSRIVHLSAIADVPVILESDRSENLLKNLNKKLKTHFARLLKEESLRPETLCFGDITQHLLTIDKKINTRFSWEEDFRQEETIMRSPFRPRPSPPQVNSTPAC